MIAHRLASVARVASRSTIFAAPIAVRAPVAARFFSSSLLRASDSKPTDVEKTEGPRVSLKIEDVTTESDLFGPGAEPGTVPTNFEQATGLERLEMLAEMAGIDLFDESPLPAERIGTIADPVIVESGTEQKYLGCTGVPADSHEIEWISATIHSPARCLECGAVYKLTYVGAAADLVAAHH
ncbi:cytochrome c oxidase subunit VB-domain-containing protein [Limtongia smithiae]|uniref:cytochrome c oxidase subunit VB-domain-containing protein n=1 Tax=Limtongia smithiae TaxID=1125753 RepID=UPI0034CD072E